MARPEAPLSAWTSPILVVGCGTMAGAIVARWVDTGLPPGRIHVVDPGTPKLPDGVSASPTLPDHLADGGVVLLGIKPQGLGSVAPALDATLGCGTTVVSMLAGLPLAVLASALPSAAAILRIMPNLPVRSGEGVVLRCGQGDVAPALPLLAPLGLVEPLAEDQFDLGTALSGCGPAFLYRFVDALAAAGERLGLDGPRAARLALATVAGAAATAARAPDSPAALADAVASPGGMTRLGLDRLDADEALVALLVDTLRVARDRGAELATAGLSGRAPGLSPGAAPPAR